MWINALCDAERPGGLTSSRVWPVLARVGLFSYSLYLVHTPALGITKQIGLRLGFGPDPLGLCAVLGLRILVPVLTGYVFFRSIEIHFLRRQPQVTQTAPAVN